jgi:hypothetical protein
MLKGEKQNLRLLACNLARWRCHIACDAGISPRLHVCLLLVLAACGAGLVLHNSCLLIRLLVRLFRLGLLGHADEPVERKGGEDVEDAVCPENAL